MVKNNIIYKTIEGFPNELECLEIEKNYSEIFKDANLSFFKTRIKDNPQLLSILAYSNDNIIGFKIGYPYNKTTFYSWIGGVLPQYRKQGVALNLFRIQEQYAKDNGFTKLRTKSMNQFKPMMILNLKNDFNITSIYTNTKGQTKIVFEKTI